MNGFGSPLSCGRRGRSPEVAGENTWHAEGLHSGAESRVTRPSASTTGLRRVLMAFAAPTQPSGVQHPRQERPSRADHKQPPTSLCFCHRGRQGSAGLLGAPQRGHNACNNAVRRSLQGCRGGGAVAMRSHPPPPQNLGARDRPSVIRLHERKTTDMPTKHRHSQSQSSVEKSSSLKKKSHFLAH